MIKLTLDNLEDFYSSVVDNDLVKRRKFVIQKYNLSETRLQTGHHNVAGNSDYLNESNVQFEVSKNSE